MSNPISQFKSGKRILQAAIVSATVMTGAAVASASPSSMVSSTAGPDRHQTSLAIASDATPTASPLPEPSTLPTGEPPKDSITSTTRPPDSSTSNHGTYVSKVARCVPPGPGHGEAVREMAQTHDGEAAKADEICSRYATASSVPTDEAGEDHPGRAHQKDSGKPAKSEPSGKSGKKGMPGGR